MRPLRDYRFMTPYEKEWDRAFALAMAGFTDVRSDEMQILGEQITDDMHDLYRIFADYFTDRDSAMAGQMLGKLLDRVAERVANEAAQKACETVPQERAA